MMPIFTQAALAISTALFDNLWESVLIAGIVLVVLRLSPGLGAATRYVVWLLALGALVVTPLLSVIVPSVHVSTPATQRVAQPDTMSPPAPAIVSPQFGGGVELTQAAAATNEHITIPQSLAILCTITWMLIVSWRALLLVTNMRDLAVIRSESRYWRDGQGYPVMLSHRVRVPIAIGLWRPAIVLPESLAAEQPAEAVDAIIVHEAAHLRRHDVFTNALARVLEAALAFNPIAWFVMRRLAVEREIACDDWVVSNAGAGDVFARALASMASCSTARVPLAAPSALGSKHSVVARIERLLDSRPRHLSLSLSTLGGTLMFLALIAIILQSVSPVLAYASLTPVTIVAANGCATPNRGAMGQSVRLTSSGPVYGAYISLPTQTGVARDKWRGTLVLVDVTVDASGTLRKATMVSGSGYPGADAQFVSVLNHMKYRPAIQNCVAVASTTRVASVMSIAPPAVYSFVAPSYPNGWSAQHASACKVPNLLHSGVPKLPASVNLPKHGRLVASVDVHVDANGAVTSASLVQSSGQAAYDDAVLAAAKVASYPLDGKTGFQAVRPSGTTLAWNATHGYDAFSKCAPLPTEYVWTATYKSRDQSPYAGAGP